MSPGSAAIRDELPTIVLTALFVTSLVTSQIIAAKVLGFELPFALPATGTAIIVPAGVLAYAVTFFASDCLSELSGKRTAQIVVNVGFAMNFVVLALVALAVTAPDARSLGIAAGVPPDVFATTLGFTPNIILGSLFAYLVSQNLDVVTFHAIRDRTGAHRLWLRNVASTATSQLVDTIIFISIAFFAAPALLGSGSPSSLATILGLIVGQYVVKLLIAVLDTPFVYLVVRTVQARRQERFAQRAGVE